MPSPTSPSRDLRVVLSVANVDPETGGPARSVTGLACALQRHGLEVVLVTREPRASPLPFPLPSDVRWAPPGRWRGVRAFQRQLTDAVAQRPGTVLHDHGIWLPTNHAAARVARKLGAPFVVSPRGMLDPWSMAHHPRRKRLAWWLYQRRDLAGAALLHATSGLELRAVRACGLTQPVAVVGNGLNPVPDTPQVERRPREALFLSRIHPKKGLLELVAAWDRVRPAGWTLRIVGPDEGGHASVVASAVARAGLSDQIRMEGPLEGPAKQAALARAALFVLPTWSENFGLVVAEALAAGLPVLTTQAAPWEALRTEHAGWWVEPGVEGLVAGLAQATSSSREALEEMGARGRAFARERFGWDDLARRMAEVYAWVVHGGTPPPDIHGAGERR